MYAMTEEKIAPTEYSLFDCFKNKHPKTSHVQPVESELAAGICIPSCKGILITYLNFIFKNCASDTYRRFIKTGQGGLEKILDPGTCLQICFPQHGKLSKADLEAPKTNSV